MQQGLQKAILSPSFTPRVRDSEAVADLLWQGLATPQAVTVALLRIGRPAIPALLRVLMRAPAERRAELVPVLGRLICETAADDPAPLLALLDDDQRKVGRAAVIALGKLPQPSQPVEAQLIAHWNCWTESADRRALAEALGKIGGPAALALLQSQLAESPDGSVLHTVMVQAPAVGPHQ